MEAPAESPYSRERPMPLTSCPPTPHRADEGEGCSVVVDDADGGRCGGVAARLPLVPRRSASLLLASIAILSSIYSIDSLGASVLAEALESPTISDAYKSNREPARFDGGDASSVDQRSGHLREEGTTLGMQSSSEQNHASPGQAEREKWDDNYPSRSSNSRQKVSPPVRAEGDPHDDNNYPPRNRQKVSPPSIRKERQKQRQMQRQKQQQQLQQKQSQAVPAGEEGIDLAHREQQPQQQQQLTKSEYDAYAYDAYMRWCERVLGIRSSVEIKEFEYVDHLQMYWDDNDVDEYYSAREFEWLSQYSEATAERDGGGREVADEALPTKLVRGLAAKRDIAVGDVVISIPLYSLLSIPTTIDHDPVLSRILGPDAREKYGWTDAAEYELPLLVLAVLYHRSLGGDSPISHYVDILLGTSLDAFPFLWTDAELRERAGGGVPGGGAEGVVRLARGIRRDLHQMYDEVMLTLVRERPEWFAPPAGYEPSADGGEEWIYSYENFQWAFALVISRHHYLPIKDFDDEDGGGGPKPDHRLPAVHHADSPSRQQVMHETLSSVSEVVPPANQPTDQWVDEAHNEERVVEGDDIDAAYPTDDDVAGGAAARSAPVKHSFLAPLADLINFGPPCLTGSYNQADHVFELIATCPFTRGQEVTFWYSSDCSDVIIANFGFLHPLVPPCVAPEDWQKRSDEWREKTELREQELWEVYRKYDMLKEELASMESQLRSCECSEDGEKKRVYAMPTASSSGGGVAEANSQNLRKDGGHHSLRQEFGVRGRMHDQHQQEITHQVMEELG